MGYDPSSFSPSWCWKYLGNHQPSSHSLGGKHNQSSFSPAHRTYLALSLAWLLIGGWLFRIMTSRTPLWVIACFFNSYCNSRRLQWGVRKRKRPVFLHPRVPGAREIDSIPATWVAKGWQLPMHPFQSGCSLRWGIFFSTWPASLPCSLLGSWL